MNRHLLRNWRRRVGAGNTVICLGDVAHPDAWRDDRLVLDLAECPGERLLVLGNGEMHAILKRTPADARRRLTPEVSCLQVRASS